MVDETTREQQLAEQFKEGLDPAGAVAMATRVEELEGQVATLTQERDAAPPLGSPQLAELEAQVATLQGERDTAVAQVAKLTRAAKTSVTKGENASKPRKLGLMKEGGALTGEALNAALAEAEEDEDKIEIVISDGTREILGIPPIVVTGDVWRDHTRGKMLRDPVLVHGPQRGASPFAIDGYALLIDGKQVAYTKRPDVINVGADQQVSLADDIYF